MKSVPYLQLGSIKTDVQLMKLLPSDIARRYHALPVGTAGGKITIAMASPEDATASAAVASAIGAPVCFVKANPREIDQRLDELWQYHSIHRLRILFWSPVSGSETKLLPYSLALAKLLEADLKQADIPLEDCQSFTKLIFEFEQSRPDLVIVQSNALQILEVSVTKVAASKIISQIPTSVLIAKNPRWPLATILLALPNGEYSNHPAANWAVQIAGSSRAVVTVLPLLTTTSGLNKSIDLHSMQTLLKTKNPLGQKMRFIAQQFSEEGIKGAFKLREGEPQDQLRCEILASDPDLVIIATELQDYLWIADEVFAPLLESVNCPILISS